VIARAAAASATESCHHGGDASSGEDLVSVVGAETESRSGSSPNSVSDTGSERVPAVKASNTTCQSARRSSDTIVQRPSPPASIGWVEMSSPGRAR